VRKKTLSFEEVIRHDVLRQAQAPVQALAERVADCGDSARSDSQSGLQEPGITVSPKSTTVKRDDDGVVIVSSPTITQAHFDPYKMAVFASNELQAVRIRAELQTWIDLASNELDNPHEKLVSESHIFVNWLKSLSSEHKAKAAHFAKVAHLAGLVAQYCHPHADARMRAETLDELRSLADEGLDEANKVVELLTSPATEIAEKHELEKQKDFVDSPLTGVRFQLVEDTYEVAINRLVKHRPDETNSSRPLDRLIRETKLRNEQVKIVIAGDLEHVHSIYSLYTLLKDQVDTLEIPNVLVDTGITDTAYYINTDEGYVRRLKRWFNKSQQNIPSLAHLIRSAANNDISEFRIKRGVRYFVPSEEQLVLFYLRMLSRQWNNVFAGILGSVGERRKNIQREYWTLVDKMRRSIPRDWRTAIEAHLQFSEFMRQEHPKYREALNALQPVNLLTDNQLNQATLIVMTTQDSMTGLVRRFPAGVAGKIMLLTDVSLEQAARSPGNIGSPYTPRKLLSGAKWDPSMEKLIEKKLLEYLVPKLNQEVSTEKIKAVRLVQQKRASRDAIESVKQYVMHLQRLSSRGQDKSLIGGLTFLSAVMQDIDPYSSEWKQFVDRHKSDREAVNNAVFGTKTRTLSDAAAIRFLTNYVGPKKYVDRKFSGIYEKYNEEVLKHLVECLGNRLSSVQSGT